MYKVKCQSTKPERPGDIHPTPCQKDAGHQGHHYGNDTHNQLLTSTNIEMVSWENQPENYQINLPFYEPAMKYPRYYSSCPRCEGTAAHE